MLADWLRAVLPSDAAQTWETVAPALPDELYLAGGTGLAVHLRHRQSRDLDFFYHHGAVDLAALEADLRRLGTFAVSDRAAGTLTGVFSRTKLQFLHADEVKPQRQLEPARRVAGLPVAGIGDILAMKLKVIRERGELRDYFDVMAIEQQAGRTVEEGLGLHLARYGLPAEPHTLEPIVRALGYLDDVDEDALLPIGKHDIAAYWAKRQPDIIRSLGRIFGRPGRRVAGAPDTSPTSADLSSPTDGGVWISGYQRQDGTQVRGHHRGYGVRGRPASASEGPADVAAGDDRLRELVAQGRIVPPSKSRPSRPPRLAKGHGSASASVISERDAER